MYERVNNKQVDDDDDDDDPTSMTIDNVVCHFSSFDAPYGDLMRWFRFLHPFVICMCRNSVIEVIAYLEISDHL